MKKEKIKDILNNLFNGNSVLNKSGDGAYPTSKYKSAEDLTIDERMALRSSFKGEPAAGFNEWKKMALEAGVIKKSKGKIIPNNSNELGFTFELVTNENYLSHILKLTEGYMILCEIPRLSGLPEEGLATQLNSLGIGLTDQKSMILFHKSFYDGNDEIEIPLSEKTNEEILRDIANSYKKKKNS